MDVKYHNGWNHEKLTQLRYKFRTRNYSTEYLSGGNWVTTFDDGSILERKITDTGILEIAEYLFNGELIQTVTK